MFLESLYRQHGPIQPTAVKALLDFLSGLDIETDTDRRAEKAFATHDCRVIMVYRNRRVLHPAAHAAMLPLQRHLREAFGYEGAALNGRVLYRAELSFVRPGAAVTAHYDPLHFHKVGDRLHVPLITDDTRFEGRWFPGDWQSYTLHPLHLYSLNNRVPHRVENKGSAVRVHAIFDFVTLADAKLYATTPERAIAYCPVAPDDSEYSFIGEAAAHNSNARESKSFVPQEVNVL